MLQAHTARGRQDTSPTLRELCDQLFDVMDRCDLYGARDLVRRLRDLQKSSLTRQRRVALSGDAAEMRARLRAAFLEESLPDSLLPDSVLSDPSVPTYLAYAQEANCAVTLGSGITTRMPLASLTEYRSSLGEEQSIAKLVVRIPNRKLESGLVLIEVPGPGSVLEGNEEADSGGTENKAARKKTISEASSHAHVTLYCVSAREDRLDEVGRLLGGRRLKEAAYVVFEMPVDVAAEGEQQIVSDARATVCGRFGLAPWQVMSVAAQKNAPAAKFSGTGIDRVKSATDKLAGLRAQNQLSHEVREAAEEVLEKARRTAEFKKTLLPNPKLRKAVRLAEIAFEHAQALAGQSSAELEEFTRSESQREAREQLQLETGFKSEPRVGPMATEREAPVQPAVEQTAAGEAMAREAFTGEAMAGESIKVPQAEAPVPSAEPGLTEGPIPSNQVEPFRLPADTDGSRRDGTLSQDHVSEGEVAAVPAAPQGQEAEEPIPSEPELVESSSIESDFLVLTTGQAKEPEAGVIESVALSEVAPEVFSEPGLDSGLPRLEEDSNAETVAAVAEPVEPGAVDSSAPIVSQPGEKPGPIKVAGETKPGLSGSEAGQRPGAGEQGARFAQFATTRASNFGFERRTQTTSRPLPSTLPAGAPDPAVPEERGTSSIRDAEGMEVQRKLSAGRLSSAPPLSEESRPSSPASVASEVDAQARAPINPGALSSAQREETKREEGRIFLAPSQAFLAPTGQNAAKSTSVEDLRTEDPTAESNSAQPTIFAQWRTAGELEDDEEELSDTRRSQWVGWTALAGAVVFTVLMISLIAGRVHPNAISEAWNAMVGRQSRLAVHPVAPLGTDSLGEGEKGVSTSAAGNGGEPAAAGKSTSQEVPGSGYTGVSTPPGNAVSAGGARGGVPASGLAAGYRSEGAVPEPAIQSALNQWVNSYRSQDVSQLASCYAPFVDTYYGLRNLRPMQVAREKANEWRNVASIPVYRVTPISVTDQGNGQKAVLLQKDWSRTTTWGTISSGSDIERLVLVRIDSEWKIVEEQQVKILRPRRG